MTTCDHSLGIFSTMKTISVTRDYFTRKCEVCGVTEKLRRAGKISVGYSIEAESIRDFDRRAKAKELLQPQPGKYDEGPVSELFDDAYGDPFKKKTKIGSAVEKSRIKEKHGKKGRT